MAIPCQRRKNKNILECPFASAKNPLTRKKPSYSFDKDQTDVLAAIDQGSNFGQEKLIALDKEEKSQ